MKTIIQLFCFLFSVSFLNAQSPEWTTYSSSNSGLPSNNILTLAIDGSGNKWIGTNNSGLVKFEGTKWTVYNISNSDIPGNMIYAVEIDAEANKWISAGGVLAKFDDTNWSVYTGSNSGLPNNSVLSIAIDGSGNKWIGTDGGGLVKFDGTNWTVYNTANSGLPDNHVRIIAIDGSGNKWIGTFGGGLAKFDGTNWTVYNTSNSGIPSNSLCYSIAIDKSGTKWFADIDSDLIKFDNTTWTVYNSLNSAMPPYKDVRSIAFDSSGNKWIGTEGGLVKYDGTNWTAYTTLNSGLPNDFLTSIAIDGSDKKWIGAFGSGVAVFKGGGSSVPVAEVLNGEFDNGTQDWQLSTYAAGVAATIKIDTNSVISGHNSAAVQISQTTGTDWHIQLWQGLSIYPGHKYTISFKAKASAARSIVLALQKSVSPYTTYLYKAHNLTTQVQTFTDEVTISSMDQAKLQFYFGSSTVSVWIDDITIVDTPLTTGIDEPDAANGNISVLQNYPNPFNTTTTIKYKVTEPGFVSIKVLNTVGAEVASLVNEEKTAGEYSVKLNASGLSNGIYFCWLQSGTLSKTRKLILSK